jgi:hypothetical protein
MEGYTTVLQSTLKMHVILIPNSIDSKVANCIHKFMWSTETFFENYVKLDKFILLVDI